MARRNPCDVPGCTNLRRRHQRICDRCFGRLPGDIRTGIIDMFRQRRWPEWRAFRRRAAEFLARREHAPAIAPETVFERNARLLGERADA